jgi:hypothetical protein
MGRRRLRIVFIAVADEDGVGRFKQGQHPLDLLDLGEFRGLFGRARRSRWRRLRGSRRGR